MYIDRLRPLSYPDTTCFLIFFSCVNPTSMINVEKKWIPEIRHHCPETPILLVGTKIDLRDNEETLEKLHSKNLKPISTNEGKKFAQKIGAFEYIEISSKNRFGVEETVLKAIIDSTHQNISKDKNCNLQ